MSRVPKYIPVAAARLAPAPANLFCGTSGWSYPTWKPGFYPTEVPSKAFLHYYATKLTSVEVNYTFRELCEEEQLNGWLAATPPGFRFSFKAPQRITHFQRLRTSAEAAAEFVASVEPVRKAHKLGPLLFQLPPTFKANTVLLDEFLRLPALADPSLQTAFEFRHASWFNEATYDVLRRYNAAMCIAESNDLVTPEVHTARHLCYRLRRNGGYKPAELKTFAAKFTELAVTREVFTYFKHEDAPTGALNASAMLRAAVNIVKKREDAQ